MPQFRVLVPFDPVIYEDLDSRVFTQLPDCELVGGLKIRRTAEGYVAELEVDAPRPGAAKQLVLEATERLLAVLASWNHGFQVRVGGVMSEMIADDSPVATSSIAPGVIAVSASDTMFLEDHVEAVVRKASLDAEGGVYRRYAELPESVRSCLELNYLLVLSTRPPNRWLLAATGLEALAVGAGGPQKTLSDRLSEDDRKKLADGVARMLDGLGLADLAERLMQRVLTMTLNRVADHVHDSLAQLGMTEVSADEINRWWRVRGALAHGAQIEFSQAELNRLVAVFQTALRRSAGAEAAGPAAG